MPSVRVWNSGGPPKTRLAAMVSPPLLLEPLLPLELLLPDWPQAVSAVSRTVVPVTASAILCRAILCFMDVSPEVGRGARGAEVGSGRRVPRGTVKGSGGRELLGGLQLRERGRAAVGSGGPAGEPAGHPAGDG